MPAFKYQALDSTGRMSSGAIQADTPRSARAQLRSRNLHAVSIDEIRSGKSADGGLRLGGNDKIFLTRQMATLIRANLPLEEALVAISEAAVGKSRMVSMALRARIMEGMSLASAMGEFTTTFDALYRSSISAGEKSGQLGNVLLRLAEHLEARDALRRRMIGALAYPALLLVVAVLATGGLMLYVVPEVSSVFLRAGQSLPLPTRILLWLSRSLQAGAIYVVPVALGAVALPWCFRTQRALRHRRDLEVLRIPLVGRLVLAMEFSRFARTLALLSKSSVPLLDALKLASQTVQNLHLRESLEEVRKEVRAGTPLSTALSRGQRFPVAAVRMIANGERTGRLDPMLDEAASQLERELDLTTAVAMATLGPLVILIVGGMVLFIVLAILLPIFEMNQLIA